MRPLQALAAGMSGRASALEDPTVAMTSGRLLSQVDSPDQLWSGADSGTGDPLKVGTALRCVQLLSAAVAGCPLQVTERGSTQAVSIPLLDAYREGQTPFELWETVVAHIALWGNAYVRKVRGPGGRIVGLLPIHPNRVRVETVDDRSEGGLPFGKVFIVDGRVREPLTAYEVMHVPGLSTDGVRGISIVANVRRTFGLAERSERMADRFYEQGMLLAGFLSTDAKLDQEKAEILRERWRAKLAGIDNAYEVAVLDQGTKFQQLSMSPADAQFLETRKFSTTEIARMFGVPGWLINDQEKSTSWGSGMEQQFTALVQITLKPYMQRIEQRITRELCDPRLERAEFKVEGLLRGDSRARAAFYNAGITGGWMVPNDVRPLEGLPDVAWGDVPYRPYNEPAGAAKPPSTDDDEGSGDADS